ncbi:hypothetical protein P280DRAFT_198964 [Massarina eburnea CBS 473.64]|uniref:Uncharacterized protein n=1 Tax=Massarina eburnea CBS 473.64 TaxID=1395130 RepID=A0A6A6RLZ2_9PLEO|nr:hypothetical protein P280DRAFT_198964 [Massarina eburnea CBS 473.64]
MRTYTHDPSDVLKFCRTEDLAFIVRIGKKDPRVRLARLGKSHAQYRCVSTSFPTVDVVLVTFTATSLNLASLFVLWVEIQHVDIPFYDCDGSGARTRYSEWGLVPCAYLGGRNIR